MDLLSSRQMAAAGASCAEIARLDGCDWRTARKYLSRERPQPPRYKPRPPKPKLIARLEGADPRHHNPRAPDQRPRLRRLLPARQGVRAHPPSGGRRRARAAGRRRDAPPLRGAFAAHYGFTPRVCWPERPQSKGAWSGSCSLDPREGRRRSRLRGTRGVAGGLGGVAAGEKIGAMLQVNIFSSPGSVPDERGAALRPKVVSPAPNASRGHGVLAERKPCGGGDGRGGGVTSIPE